MAKTFAFLLLRLFIHTIDNLNEENKKKTNPMSKQHEVNKYYLILAQYNSRHVFKYITL